MSSESSESTSNSGELRGRGSGIRRSLTLLALAGAAIAIWSVPGSHFRSWPARAHGDQSSGVPLPVGARGIISIGRESVPVEIIDNRTADETGISLVRILNTPTPLTIANKDLRVERSAELHAVIDGVRRRIELENDAAGDEVEVAVVGVSQRRTIAAADIITRTQKRWTWSVFGIDTSVEIVDLLSERFAGGVLCRISDENRVIRVAVDRLRSDGSLSARCRGRWIPVVLVERSGPAGLVTVRLDNSEPVSIPREELNAVDVRSTFATVDGRTLPVNVISEDRSNGTAIVEIPDLFEVRRIARSSIHETVRREFRTFLVGQEVEVVPLIEPPTDAAAQVPVEVKTPIAVPTRMIRMKTR